MLLFTFSSVVARGQYLLLPMDEVQTNHLKAYGVVYNAIAAGKHAEWMLNYRGGSFVLPYSAELKSTCTRLNVSCSRIDEGTYRQLVARVNQPAVNGALIRLDKVPRIAVYTPPGKMPWDDAVTLALTYAQIPFDKVYVNEVLAGRLSNYDWLHLHHEDFTGQQGKFWAQYNSAPWYRAEKASAERLAAQHGYSKIWQMQQAVVQRILTFVASGGNLFAMCSATDTYDIAMAAMGIDICSVPYDGDPPDPDAQKKLNFDRCFAFTDFTISTNPAEYEYATIDNTGFRFIPESTDYFTLNAFPADFDPVPAMLCQNHVKQVKGFMGQTTAFRKEAIKPGVMILGERKDIHEARYIHGTYKQGTWTFYGGHDPEDYQHLVGEPATDLDLHPNSPGYRLILNNVLCLASGKKDVAPIISFSGPTDAPPPPANTETGFRIAAGSSINTLRLSAIAANAVIRTVAFIDASGKTLRTEQYNAPAVNVSLEGLPQGLYTIRINGTYVGKVVKN